MKMSRTPFYWYESEELGLGEEFLEEVRAAYHRIEDAPLHCQELRSGIRRALTHRFPYSIFFSLDDDTIIVLAVLHVARNPREWLRRI
jgi:plasmid stabilization system protein ParE